MWLYFFHQGIGIEVLIMLLPVVILKSFSTFTLISSIPLILFIVIKAYCWLTMLSLYKVEKNESQKINFGKQWILNSLFIMQPSVRLTIPALEENTQISIPYEQLRWRLHHELFSSWLSYECLHLNVKW